MINIAGRIFVTLKIDGNPIPHSVNLIERITMTEGMGALSPACELILNDYEGSLTKELALTDGNELHITVGKEPNAISTQTRQYRVFGVRQITTAFGPRMQVVGIYDAPGYLTGSVRESFKDNTAAVIKQIAERCKLCYYGIEDFNGRKADDKQVWMNIAKSRAMFVQQITRHGYIDEHSAMYSTLTSLGQLRYLNLNDVIETPKEKIKRMFVHNTFSAPSDKKGITTYTVREAHTRSTAGLMNTWQNYGSTRIEHNLSGEETKHEEVQVKTSADYLAINDKVKKNVERSRFDYTPIDCGNTHKNYQKAIYQNVKLLSLFSEHVSILTYDPTDVQPLDVVIYRQANADAKMPVSNSDIYLVIGKSIVVAGGKNYAERIELVRHNVTEKGATELTCADNSKAAESAVPNSTIDPTPQAAIGANALPTSQNLSEMTKDATQQFASARSMMPDLKNAAGFAMPSLSGLTSTLNEVKNGTGSINQLVGQVKGSLASVTHYANIGTNFARQMVGTAVSVAQLGTAIKNAPKTIPAAVKNAMLYQRNGIVNSFTHTMGGMRQQMQMASLVYPISTQLQMQRENISRISGGLEAIDEFSNQTNRIVTNANMCRRQAANVWNQSLSIINGQPIPAGADINPQNAMRMSNVMSNLYRAPASGSYTCVPLDTATNDLTKAMLDKSFERQPNWINPDDPFDYDTAIAQAQKNYLDELQDSDDSLNIPQTSYEESLWNREHYEGEDELDMKFEPPAYGGIYGYNTSIDAAEDAYADLEADFEAYESRDNEDTMYA